MPRLATDRQSAEARPRRSYQPASKRRVEIIAAAQAEFIRANYSGARTRDIADAAGVNQATLFKHFPTKQALFEEAVMRPLIDAMHGVQDKVEVYEAAETAEQLAELAQGSTLRHLADMERILPLLATALFSDVDLGRKFFQESLEPLIRARGEVLRPLVKPGIDPDFVGLASFGIMFAVAMQRWLGESGGDLAVIAAQFNRLFTSGFVREKNQNATPERDDGLEA
jgi:AcrR family transcriptional regulator